ncbi:hypothetical protein [Bacillus sp. REN10]|uniref:hypothetical protein n=1 Tax=Bacillus sp. REN10 TaxID=2782541 RepID=UPI00193B7383|nr:hypothetical protein [Bacillus sp. REN10]
MCVISELLNRWNEIDNKVLTLQEIDDYLQSISNSQSIFNVTEKQWKKWRRGDFVYFFYMINEKSIMMKMDVMLDHGVSPSTIVKVVNCQAV